MNYYLFFANKIYQKVINKKTPPLYCQTINLKKTPPLYCQSMTSRLEILLQANLMCLQRRSRSVGMKNIDIHLRRKGFILMAIIKKKINDRP